MSTVSVESIFLGIDTSTTWGTIGIVQGGTTLASIITKNNKGHAKGLISIIKDIFSHLSIDLQQLHGVGVVNGPGSFTALRVGVITAQSLGLSLRIPVIPISSMEALIQGIPVLDEVVLVTIPARKQELFVQAFVSQNLTWTPHSEVYCLPINELKTTGLKPDLVIGPGIVLYPFELGAIYGELPIQRGKSCYHSQGSNVAHLAKVKYRENPIPYPAEAVEIKYLQSHGALSIEERTNHTRP